MSYATKILEGLKYQKNIFQGGSTKPIKYDSWNAIAQDTLYGESEEDDHPLFFHNYRDRTVQAYLKNDPKASRHFFDWSNKTHPSYAAETLYYSLKPEIGSDRANEHVNHAVKNYSQHFLDSITGKI